MKHLAKDGFRSLPNHHPNIWTNYDYYLALQLLGSDIEASEKDAIRQYIIKLQKWSGGFYPSQHGDQSSILRTYSSLCLLSALGFYKDKIRKFDFRTNLPLTDVNSHA